VSDATLSPSSHPICCSVAITWDFSLSIQSIHKDIHSQSLWDRNELNVDRVSRTLSMASCSSVVRSVVRPLPPPVKDMETLLSRDTFLAAEIRSWYFFLQSFSDRSFLPLLALTILAISRHLVAFRAFVFPVTSYVGLFIQKTET
jgi:hypothetical protein